MVELGRLRTGVPVPVRHDRGRGAPGSPESRSGCGTGSSPNL